MLTLRDCLDMCDLSREVVDAIAETHHLPDILAAQFALSLSGSAHGRRIIRRALAQAAEMAARRGDLPHTERLERALAEFVTSR